VIVLGPYPSESSTSTDEQRAWGHSVRERRVHGPRFASLRHLAAKAGLTTVRLGEIERGVREPVTAEERASIEAALKACADGEGAP
jgi:hypothetical protein